MLLKKLLRSKGFYHRTTDYIFMKKKLRAQKKIHAAILAWFYAHKRELPWRKNDKRNPYHSWIAEIMLQQTRMETVLPYYQKFIQKFPTVGALEKASEDELRSLWAGLGYYRRVMNIKKTASIIVKKYHNKMPNSYEELLELPGIGPYTASAISSMCFEEYRAAIDGNWERVLSRLLAYTGIAKNSPTLKNFAQELVNLGAPGDINEAMMDLSSKVCLTKNPLCTDCPIEKYCEAKKQKSIQKFPIKKEKKRTIALQATGLVLLYQEKNSASYKVLITKRQSGTWLQNMWDIPWWIENNNRSHPLTNKITIHGIYERKRTITHHKINFSVKYSFLKKPISERDLKKYLHSIGSAFAWKPIEKEDPRLPLPSQKALLHIRQEMSI